MIRKIAQALALIYIFTIPLENIAAFGSLGSLSRICGLVAAGVWGVSIFSQNRIRSFTVFHIFVFAFLLFNVASIYWTVDFDLTLSRLKTYLQMAIQVWMLWDLFNTIKLLRAALLAFLLGAFLAIASTISNFISGQLISEWEVGRYSGSGQNAVELALILSLCFPIAWHQAITQNLDQRGRILRVVYFAFLPASFFALILTASRTAIFALIPGVIYIVGSLGRFKLVYRFLGIVLLILVVLIGQSFVPQDTLERLATIGSSIASGDLGGRMVLWRQSLDLFFTQPLLGIGSGALNAPDQLGAAAHNTFISILTELGVIGILLFLGILVSAFYHAFKQPKSSSTLWLTILIVWIIGVQSLTWEYTKSTWFFLSMITISAGVFDRRQSLKDHPVTEHSRQKQKAVRSNSLWKRPIHEKSISRSQRTR